jgi:hypothetical protein
MSINPLIDDFVDLVTFGEDQSPYTAAFGTENERLRQENTYKWDAF